MSKNGREIPCKSKLIKFTVKNTVSLELSSPIVDADVHGESLKKRRQGRDKAYFVYCISMCVTRKEYCILPCRDFHHINATWYILSLSISCHGQLTVAIELIHSIQFTQSTLRKNTVSFQRMSRNEAAQNYLSSSFLVVEIFYCFTQDAALNTQAGSPL